MRSARKLILPLVVGFSFGAVSSLANWLSQPADAGGGWFATTPGASIARTASYILDAGWAWAALAVAVGCLAGTRVRGALAGMAALLSATAGYDLVDSAFMADVSLGSYWADVPRWGIASVLLGPILGAIGATIRSPGLVGLLASLVVPAGATIQMIVLPPGGGLPSGVDVAVRTEAVWARFIVLCTAAVATALFIIDYFTRERRESRGMQKYASE